MLSDKIFRIKLVPTVLADFFVYVLNSRFLRFQIENALSGGNGLANNHPQSILMGFTICHPSVLEQQQITEAISKMQCRVNLLVTETQRSINLLKERRSALISAAVTGKIDVRGLVQEAA